jgi:nitrate reductase gamma subunit
MNTLNFFFFGVYPYIAIAVFLIGSLVRLDYEPYTWKSGSSQFLRRRGMLFASNAFHIGIILLLTGHAVGLLTPHAVYSAFGLSAETKQALAMTAGGIFGTVCLFGMAFLLHRRMTDERVKAAGSTMDTVILLLLMVQLVVGLATIPASAAHHDAGVMLALAEWAQRIVTFRSGADELVAGAGMVFRLHLVIGLTILLLFPFSRLVHIWSVPLAYLGRRYQVVRRRGQPARRLG